jgi:hypothetical protein
MPSTYTPIATYTVPDTTTITVTFSSIPSTYTDLIMVCYFPSKSSSSETMLVRVNGDSGTNYSSLRIEGTGSSAISGTTANSTYAAVSGGGINTTISNIILNFQNYSNTTTFKTILNRFNQPAVSTSATVSTWRSTAAINSILVQGTAGYLGINSVVSLYGIKAA